MANPATFSGYAGLGLLVSASTASQDLAANTSTLNVNLYLTGMYAGSYSASSYSNYTVQQPTGSVFASGDSGAYSITNTQSVLIYSGTRVVTHDANGDITTTLTGYDDTFNGTATATMSYTPASTARVPTATTQAVSAIATTTATGNGNITWGGNNPISERGICYGTSANPTTANDKDTAAGTTGAFTTSITALTPNTLYHARAYAINGKGTSYGADVTFTTLPSMGVLTNPANVYGAGYATTGSTVDSGKVSVDVSKDGGTSWSVAQSQTLTTGAGDTTLTFGSATDTWGLTMTGAQIKHTTNFLVRITCGTSIQFQNGFKGFTFDAEVTDTVAVLGIKAVVVAKYVAGTNLSVDSLLVTATVSGTSDNVIEGSTAYNSTIKTLTAYNGTSWVPMVTNLTGVVTSVGNATSIGVNPYKFDVRLNGDQALSGTETTNVVFNAENFDSNNNFNTGTGAYTTPVDGYYMFTTHVRVDAGVASYFQIHMAGNKVNDASRADQNVLSGSVFGYFAASTAITVGVYHAGTATVKGDSADASTFSGFLVSV